MQEGSPDQQQLQSQPQPQLDRQSEQKQCPAYRFIHNITPSTKQLSHQTTIPNAVHYTPLHSELDPPLIPKSPNLLCQKCHSYVNRYCDVQQGKGLWVCCICREVNSLTGNIQGGVMEGETFDIMAEGTGANQSKQTKKQKLYLFVVDLCISPKQLQSIKQSLLAFLYSKSTQQYEGVQLTHKFGLITYSKYVYCYEMASQLNTVISVDAQNEYDMESVCKFLGIKSGNGEEAASKYFVDITAGIGRLERRIRQIKAEGDVRNDSNPDLRCRAKRAYGQAISLAIQLCENIHSECRIVSLVGGPCTHGMGMTIGTNFQQHFRSIKEHENGQNIFYFQSASKFYRKLKQKAEGKRIVVDMFIFCLQEAGLTQMYELVKGLGGLLVQGQQFSGDLQIFQKSFAKAYIPTETNDMACSLSNNCFISVACSGDIKINGALGSCKPIQSQKGRQYVSEKAIGYGDTNMWAIGGIDCYKTLTFFFELSPLKAWDSTYYIQFRTVFRDYLGYKKVRVTTLKRVWDSEKEAIAEGFDQQAAIVAIARWYLYRSQNEPKVNLRLWLDKMLVRWASYFSTYIKGDMQSFTLPQKLKYLPQFFYHFRRNPLVTRLGLSLDQLTYHRHALNNDTIQHCITIIQPALLAYTIEKPFPSAVRLEEQQMKNEAILLLDTYFFVMLWYGQNIVFWQKQQYHKQKQYQHVKTLLEAPYDDLQYLLASRFPYPGYYKTSTGHSKERILKSKISPIAGGESQNENVITEEKSLQAFMRVLVDIVVNQKAS